MINYDEIINLANYGNPKPPKRVHKSEQEWKKELPENVFEITRLAHTERPFSNEMCSKFDPGIYDCACCKTPLFDAKQKFESGTGWPSFSEPIEPNVIAYIKDESHGMYRIEVQCNICDSHLGHVFPDGPPPSHLRYCINALSLVKEED